MANAQKMPDAQEDGDARNPSQSRIRGGPRGFPSVAARSAELNPIALDFARLPIRDDREPDAITGFDEHGLPS